MELQKDRENLKDIRAFAADESGVGVIELVLILVVLIGLVIIFKKQINTLLENIFKQINSKSKRGLLMRHRGEVTVFLTMILVSIMTLLLVVVESARETGARLYLRMAADSSMDSVMAQYHRGLWENYRILGLETGEKERLEQEFGDFLLLMQRRKTGIR